MVASGGTAVFEQGGEEAQGWGHSWGAEGGGWNSWGFGRGRLEVGGCGDEAWW